MLHEEDPSSLEFHLTSSPPTLLEYSSLVLHLVHRVPAATHSGTGRLQGGGQFSQGAAGHLDIQTFFWTVPQVLFPSSKAQPSPMSLAAFAWPFSSTASGPSGGVCDEFPEQSCAVLISELWLVLWKHMRLKEAHQNPVMFCCTCRVHLAIS